MNNNYNEQNNDAPRTPINQMINRSTIVPPNIHQGRIEAARAAREAATALRLGGNGRPIIFGRKLSFEEEMLDDSGCKATEYHFDKNDKDDFGGPGKSMLTVR